MKKVFIGVGHGGRDGGACWSGLQEKDVNLEMALAMKLELERHGVEVGISRTTDVDDTLAQEVAKCDAFAPDLAVEIHNNAGGGKGFEVYQQQTGSHAPGSRKLAQAVEARVQELGQNSRGLKGEKSPQGYTFGWLSGCKCPAVLCEGAFLDNPSDFAMISTRVKQQAFGVAYAKGVLDCLGIAWREDGNSAGAVLYGVARQVIALSQREDAERYASAMNAEDTEAYYKVIEVVR